MGFLTCGFATCDFVGGLPLLKLVLGVVLKLALEILIPEFEAGLGLFMALLATFGVTLAFFFAVCSETCFLRPLF